VLHGEGRTETEIAKFSAKDAARYSAYQAEISRVAKVLRTLVLTAPPNLPPAGFSEAMRTRQARRDWQEPVAGRRSEGGHQQHTGAAWVFVGPTLQVAPASDLVATSNQGAAPTPSSFQYQLSATAGSVGYSISGVPNWLTPPSSTSGMVSSGTTVTFTVNATARSLPVGTYGPATITFANKDTGYGTQTRMATLTVYPPAIQVGPATGIMASGTHGGPFSPSSFRYSLSSTFGALNYSVVTPSWLTASPESGTVTTSSKTINFTINSNARGLRPDTYVNSINFYNTTNNVCIR
jgi:hypothetical protein